VAGLWGVTPPPLMPAGNWVRQTERLEFSFTVLRPRAANTVAVKYEYTTEADYVRLESRTAISGTVAAANETEAQAAIARVRPAGVKVLASSYKASRQKVYNIVGNTSDDVPNPDPESGKPGFLTEYTFSEQWSTPLAGDGALIEATLEEEFTFSGPNFQTHLTAFGRPVYQLCGYTPGQWRVRASATSSSETAARDWLKKAWRQAWPTWDEVNSALTGSSMGTTSGDRWVRKNAGGVVIGFRGAPRVTITPEWSLYPGTPVARTNGVNTSNVRLWKVSLEFTETILNVDPSPEGWTA
jgi:hypothetical protein